MLTLQQLQEQAYATAREKGWHGNVLRDQHGVVHDRVLAKHALMHTELTEAHECMELGDYAMYTDEGKPEGMTVEIADFIIRVCDTTRALGVELGAREDWLTYASRMRPAMEIAGHGGDVHARYKIGATWLAQVRRLVDQATEAARVDAWDEYAEKLTLAVYYAASIVAGFGEDLGAAIEAKMAYNKTRSHRHGGKRA